MTVTRTVHSTDAVTVAVHDFGGDGPDLLLAHATGFHGRVWAPVVEHLRSRFRCIAFDERGHGDSGRRPDGDFSWHGFALDALAVIDGLGLDRPYAAGHSCGGALLLLAEQRRPNTFGALWCYEPIVFPLPSPTPPNPDNPLAVAARRRRSSFPSFDEAFAAYAAKPFFAAVDPAALRAYVDHGFRAGGDGQVHLKCRPDDEAATFTMGTAHDAFQRLADVRCPVTVACGGRSDSIPPPVAEAIAGRLPRGRTEVFPDLGHLGPMEDPAAVAAAIASAFGRA